MLSYLLPSSLRLIGLSVPQVPLVPRITLIDRIPCYIDANDRIQTEYLISPELSGRTDWIGVVKGFRHGRIGAYFLSRTGELYNDGGQVILTNVISLSSTRGSELIVQLVDQCWYQYIHSKFNTIFKEVVQAATVRGDVRIFVKSGQGYIQWQEDCQALTCHRNWVKSLDSISGSTIHWYETQRPGIEEYWNCLIPDRSGNSCVFVGRTCLERVKLVFESRPLHSSLRNTMIDSDSSTSESEEEEQEQEETRIVVSELVSDCIVSLEGDVIIDVQAFDTTRMRRIAVFAILLESGKVHLSAFDRTIQLDQRIVAIHPFKTDHLLVLLETNELRHYEVMSHGELELR